MNFIHSVSYAQNLRFPETGLNFTLNIFLNKFGVIELFNPIKYNTSCSILIYKYDKCDETRGKISFIPIDFLENYLLNHKIINTIPNVSDKLELKKIYLAIFEKLNLFNKRFFETEKYHDIPLKYFKKPYLTSSLTQAIDFCKLRTDTDDYLNDTVLFKTIDPNTIIKRNEQEWLSKYDLSNIIYTKLFTLNQEYLNQIFYIPLIYLKNPLYNLNYTYSDIINSYNWDNIPKNKRFIIFIILYKSHFSSVIIDLNVNIKKERKKIAYFFNSCGYNPYEFSYNKNYWFIDSVYKITNHKLFKTSKNDTNLSNIPIEALTQVLQDKFQITNFVFNTFCIQYFDSECGIFSSMFLYFFINMFYYKHNNINVLDIKYVYFNLLSLGNDLMYGIIRGLLFFTREDIVLNNISEEKYLSSPYIYEIHNKKFKQYMKLYNKNLNLILKKINFYL
jgi:hypothetical protein